jgi:diaminopimelate epimerase
MKINFTKASAAGNDFIIIDNRNDIIKEDISNFVKAISDRRFAIGADGVIFIDGKTDSNLEMRYYNSDGSCGSLCGNGARCTAKYIYEKIKKYEKINFMALKKAYTAEVRDDSVCLHLPDLNLLYKKINLKIQNILRTVYYIDTGSPHVVAFLEEFDWNGNLENIDVYSLGKEIRYSPEFMPNGTNVNFINIKNDFSIEIRTYERGVEDETLACGTGTIASSIISSAIKFLRPPIKTITKSKETFIVDFIIQNEVIKNLSLTGTAKLIFDGNFNYNLEKKSIFYL